MALESSARSKLPASPLETPDSSPDAAPELQHCERLDEAERLYRAAIAARPNEPEAYYLLGLVLQKTGRYRDAMELMAAAARLRQDEPAYHFGLGLVLAELGQPNAAAACMQKATRLAPNFGDAHEKLGLMWEEMGFDEQAERCFRRALAAQPDLRTSLAKLVQIHLCRGEVVDAVEFGRRWVAVAARCAEAHHALGRALDLSGHAPDAWTCYHNALALDPDMIAARTALERSFRLYGSMPVLGDDEAEDASPRLIS